MFLSLIVSSHARDGILRHHIEAIVTWFQIDGPVEFLGIADGVGRRILHDVAILYRLVATLCKGEYKPAIAQTLRMGIGDIRLKLDMVARVEVVRQRHAVGDAHGINLDDARFLLGLVVLVALITVAGGERPCYQCDESDDHIS